MYIGVSLGGIILLILILWLLGVIWSASTSGSLTKEESFMKITTTLAVAVGLMALAACNQSPQENRADQIEANAENTADIIETNTENVADTLETNADAAADATRAAGQNAADQTRAAGENAADRVRNAADADGNSADNQ
jgi:hypothetical protein